MNIKPDYLNIFQGQWWGEWTRDSRAEKSPLSAVLNRPEFAAGDPWVDFMTLYIIYIMIYSEIKYRWSEVKSLTTYSEFSSSS